MFVRKTSWLTDENQKGREKLRWESDSEQEDRRQDGRGNCGGERCADRELFWINMSTSDLEEHALYVLFVFIASFPETSTVSVLVMLSHMA